MYYRSWALVVQLIPLDVFKEDVHSLNPPPQLYNLYIYIYISIYHSVFFFPILGQLLRD